jgi:excisionase family DNA binding protein
MSAKRKATPPVRITDDINDDGVMTVQEAVQFARLSESEIGRLVRYRVVPSLKHGRRRLIPKRGLQRYLDSLLVGAAG